MLKNTFFRVFRSLVEGNNFVSTLSKCFFVKKAVKFVGSFGKSLVLLPQAYPHGAVSIPWTKTDLHRRRRIFGMLAYLIGAFPMGLLKFESDGK